MAATIPTGSYSTAEAAHAGYSAATSAAADRVGGYLAPDGSGDVLVVCAGTGIDTRILAESYPKARVWAVEADPEVAANLMLNLSDLREQVTPVLTMIERYPRLQQQVGDDALLPPRFDVAAITFGVDHFPDQDTLYDAVTPLLKEDGGLVIVGEHIPAGDRYRALEVWHRGTVVANSDRLFALTGDATHRLLREAELAAYVSGHLAVTSAALRAGADESIERVPMPAEVVRFVKARLSELDGAPVPKLAVKRTLDPRVLPSLDARVQQHGFADFGQWLSTYGVGLQATHLRGSPDA